VCDPGVPVVCSTALIAAPLVRRAQKLEETGVPRGLDRPFHINTGSESFWSDSGMTGVRRLGGQLDGRPVDFPEVGIRRCRRNPFSV